MVILWFLWDRVAQWVFSDTANVGDVGWLGLGVFFTLVAGLQKALLQGLVDVRWWVKRIFASQKEDAEQKSYCVICFAACFATSFDMVFFVRKIWKRDCGARSTFA